MHSASSSDGREPLSSRCTPASSTPTWPLVSVGRRSARSPWRSQIVTTVASGAEEVLADATSEMVKAALPNDLTALYPTLQVQWDTEMAEQS